MIKKTVHDHRRIIFNGNGYDEAWVEEAERRGLLNLRTTADCMPLLLDEKNVKMLTSLGVMSKDEIVSRCDIMLENYCKTVTIEANTMVRMARKQIMPAIETYEGTLAETAAAKKTVVPDLACSYESGLIVRLSQLLDEICARADELEAAVAGLAQCDGIIADYQAIRDEVLPRMDALRAPVDEAEVITKKDLSPFPSYGDLLFSVK
jgi:glutamine synthetase